MKSYSLQNQAGLLPARGDLLAGLLDDDGLDSLVKHGLQVVAIQGRAFDVAHSADFVSEILKQHVSLCRAVNAARNIFAKQANKKKKKLTCPSAVEIGERPLRFSPSMVSRSSRRSTLVPTSMSFACGQWWVTSGHHFNRG